MLVTASYNDLITSYRISRPKKGLLVSCVIFQKALKAELLLRGREEVEKSELTCPLDALTASLVSERLHLARKGTSDADQLGRMDERESTHQLTSESCSLRAR
jgi:hypothetical protein